MSPEDKIAIAQQGTAISPTGAVLAFAGPVAPAGWLECNGSAISRTTYAALFTVLGTTYGIGDNQTTFNLPDLRGEFIRGWDHQRGVDPSREYGSAQDGAFGAHTHTIHGDTSGGDNPWGGIERKISTDDGEVNGSIETGIMEHLWTASTGDTETRPRNIAMMYVSKT